MSRVNDFRKILVVGDNHEEIVKKYSADTKTETHVLMKLEDAEKERKSHIKLLKTLLTDKRVTLTNEQYDEYKEKYLEFKNMDDFEYFRKMTEGCFYDEETGDALTDRNENAYYKYERCHQHRLEVTGEEGDFSDPFPLKDGTISYSAHFDEIDWDRIHNNPDIKEINRRVWEMVIDDDVPLNEYEAKIKVQMMHRISYFENFKNKDEFVKYASCLWYWGIATENAYYEVDYKTSDLDWCVNFFDKYIKPLEKKNPLLTIYEVRRL